MKLIPQFSLRSLLAFTALVAVAIWVWQHLAIAFEYRPMVYDGTSFRFDYSVILEIN